MGTTPEYQDIQNVEIPRGRYFTQNEILTGANKLVLGFKVAEKLFTREDPVGKYVKLFGQKFQVIGVIKEEGDNVFNFINFDEVIWLSFATIKKYVNTGENSNIGKMLNVQAEAGVDLAELKSEVTGILRASRRLKPAEDDNLALNELSTVFLVFLIW